MANVSDTRINHLIEIAVQKLGIDLRTCPESSVKKIVMILKLIKTQRRNICTDDELKAIEAELVMFK